MDMLIAGELALILGGLIWIKLSLPKLPKPPEISWQDAPLSIPGKPETPLVHPRVEIVKLNPDLTVQYKIRDEYLDHPDIEQVWGQQDLAIRHCDGRIQHTKEDV